MSRGRPALYSSNAERQAEYRDRKRRLAWLAEQEEEARREDARILLNENRAAQDACLSIILEAYQRELKEDGVRPVHDFKWQAVESWLYHRLREKRPGRQQTIEDIYPEEEWPRIS